MNHQALHTSHTVTRISTYKVVQAEILKNIIHTSHNKSIWSL